jgi:hypothetical protein
MTLTRKLTDYCLDDLQGLGIDANPPAGRLLTQLAQ